MAASVAVEGGPRVEEFGVGQPHLAKFRLEWGLLEEAALKPPVGEVLEADKRAPTEERPLRELSGGAEPFIFTRGECDVGGLVDLLEEEGEEVWSQEYARRKNAELERPSHDAWGIRKVAFVFCDDFMQRVYRLPLFRCAKWQAALVPAFEACGIHPSRVARCLLASMPPKTVIPPHHDSGYWVPRTHRLHCAVVTNPSVIFRVGRTVSTMRRFALTPGRVVELNNQAKHHVANLGDAYRTHLIFDYVDDAFPEFLPPQLQAIDVHVGDAFAQTRRTVALKRDAGTGPPAPHFFVLGAQKAGTTSMYEYLCQHPLVIRGTRRETHFLDWRWPGDRVSGSDDDLRRLWHETYFDVRAHRDHPALKAIDSTPSYLLASHLAIPRLQRLGYAAADGGVPLRDGGIPLRDGGIPLRAVVMLRDPAERALSHYAMIVDTNCTPAQRRTRGDAWLRTPIQDVAHRELAHLVDRGLLVPRRSDGGDAIRPPRLDDAFDLDPAALPAVLADLPNTHGSHSLLLRGLYALQLRPWFQAFGRDAILVLKCEDLATPASVARAVAKAHRHFRLPEHPLLSYDAHNTRPDKPPTDPTFLAQLRAFYAPFDADLAHLLGWSSESPLWVPSSLS